MPRHYTTAGELRKMLDGLPDHAPVLAPSSDHSYHPAVAAVGTALYCRQFGWSEDFDEDLTDPEFADLRRLTALIVR
jgi:hypothetical protein